MLNSNDIAEKTQGDISLMTVGADLAYTKKWDRTSLSGKVQYTDLRPYQDMIEQDFDWDQAPNGKVAEFVFRQKVKENGLLKVYANMDLSNLAIRQPNINNGGIKDTVAIDNNYFYLNTTYREMLNNKWTLRAGLSSTLNEENLNVNSDDIDENEKAFHAKLAFNWEATEKVSVNMGTEFFGKKFTQEFAISNGPTGAFNFADNIASTFVEADYFASNKFVVRTGLRLENSSLLNQTWVNPRIAMSYKLTEKGQFSLAYGDYLQSAQNNYVLVNNQLKPEKATHYILNYQHIHDNRVFRVETYLKQYDDLVKFVDLNNFNPNTYTNNGFGEAKGVDVFWRDGKTFKETDYWISYSYVDSERDYQDFAQLATPSFVSNHNFSFVVKHFVTPLRTQFGATYNFASARPFHNPNKAGFMNDQTPTFQDLSLNAAVLLKPNIILYMSSSNIFGRDNVFGYQYASQANDQGLFDRQVIGQGAKRFVFIGLFITLSKDGNENQLDNL